MDNEPKLNPKAFPYVQKCGEGADPVKMYQERMRKMFGASTAPTGAQKEPAPAEAP